MLINIKCNNGTTVPVEAEAGCKVLEFKEMIATKVNVPAAQQVRAPPSLLGFRSV